MRKVICFVAILSLIFSGCSDMTVSDQIPRTFSSQQNVVLEDDINGLFISDSNGFLKFLDFETMQTVYICPKPNCSHNDEQCTSFGLSDCPCYYQGKLYYFVRGKEYNKESRKYDDTLTAYVSNADGTNRIKLDYIVGFADFGIRKVLSEGIIYLTLADTTKAGDQAGYTSSDYMTHFIYSFDISSCKFEQLMQIGDTGFKTASAIVGMMNDDIYINYKSGVTSEEEESSAVQYACYNVTNNTWTNLDMNIICISEGHMLCRDDENMVVFHSNGEYLTVEDYAFNLFDHYGVYNGYLISPYVEYAVDVHNGKRYTLNLPNGIVYTAYNGKFIVNDNERYEKYEQNDIIGAELA